MAGQRALAVLFLGLLAAYAAPVRKTRKAPAATGERAIAKDAIAKEWMSGLTLRDRIAQLIILTSYGEAPPSRSSAYRDYVRAVRELKVGGLIVVNRVVRGSVRSAEPYAMAAFVNRMQRLARIPLLVGADFERGASMRVSDTPKYPHLMAYGAANEPELTKALGMATAREARALGVHWVFAPVADVNNNPDNPIINIRSFGENPADVASQVRAFLEGAHSDSAHRVLTTVKHFPGHGDTAVDSHMGLAQLTADRARMDAVELVPFRAAIDSGVDAVMTAHMAVPAYEEEEIPATVSPKILTGLLREQLKFTGLVVTDAMDMQGLAKQFDPGEAAVRAISAGADVLLMPPDAETALKAVLAAVRSGRLTEKRINESVLRVLSAKARVGLHRRKLVDLEQISDGIGTTESEEHAQTAADRAVTLVKNENSFFPLAHPAKTCVWVLTEGRQSVQGKRFAEELRSRIPDIRLQVLDPEVPLVEMDILLEKTEPCPAHVVAAFVSVAAYRGNVALRGDYPAFLEKLQSGGAPIGLISLGSPYLLRSFPWVAAYMTTLSPVLTSEAAAAKAMLSEIDVRGRLPVTIPGLAKYGESITLLKKDN